MFGDSPVDWVVVWSGLSLLMVIIVGLGSGVLNDGLVDFSIVYSATSVTAPHDRSIAKGEAVVAVRDVAKANEQIPVSGLEVSVMWYLVLPFLTVRQKV